MFNGNIAQAVFDDIMISMHAQIDKKNSFCTPQELFPEEA